MSPMGQFCMSLDISWTMVKKKDRISEGIMLWG